MNGKEDINAVKLVEERANEIQYIENSINQSNKKTMLFQRMPFYKRRRNRNYDKRKSKKFTYRKKDRHFLRTHTYYAKRFFMLKLQHNRENNNIMTNAVDSTTNTFNDLSIPIKRRIKSSKFIYKSQSRGFVFDESFRGVYCYKTAELINELMNLEDTAYINQKDNDHIPTAISIDLEYINKNVDLSKYDQIQTISNLFDVIITKEQTYFIGAFIGNSKMAETALEISIAVYKKSGYCFSELSKIQGVLIVPDKQNRIQTHKILCKRSQVMEIYQILINNNIVPICLDEIHRLALESDEMTVYDNIGSNIFKLVENAANGEVIEKYKRTPKAKKQKMNTDQLYLFNTEKVVYCIYKAIKGCPKHAAFVYKKEETVGRVVRGGYKFTDGMCYGLCVIEEKYKDLITSKDILECINMGQSNVYTIEITKILTENKL